jgi:hypothetical protein
MKMAVLLLFAVGCSSHATVTPSDSADIGIPPTTWPRIRPNIPSMPVHDEEPVAPAPTMFERGGSVGRRDGAGNFYDLGNHRVGRIDSTDNYYDRTGTYVGRRNDDGSFFDRTGVYTGRIDVSGNVYDGRGAKIGQIDGGCDAICEEDAVGRMLLAP